MSLIHLCRLLVLPSTTHHHHLLAKTQIASVVLEKPHACLIYGLGLGDSGGKNKA